ncbi:DUF5723 family protein [Salegentibacter chungangensis]|uniref:DUF5723 family protein n=1 Tax=Salegentibacter chungangensis TaxID=1335724 RepID=A0ABW3NSA2_9FLAO
MRYWIAVIFTCFLTGASAQHKPLLYNVDNLPQTLRGNPGAQIKFNSHIGIPFFSQISLSAGSSGVTLFDIFNDENDNVNLRVREAIRNMTFKDHFSVNEQWEIASLGWRLDNRSYLSAGIYQELDAFSYFPKDLALLMNEGNSNYINQSFDFSQVAFTAEVMTVYHIGLNFRWDNDLTVGGRVKFYSGIFNVESTGNTGEFVTVETPEGPNVYRHFARNIDVLIQTSGFASLKNEEGMSVQEATADLLGRSFFGGNLGIGVDLGFTYEVNEQFKVTGAVRDLGVMFQQQDVESYHYYGDYQTDGLEPLFPELDENDEAIPYWDIFEDEVNANLRDDTFNKPYRTWRPFKLVASAEYGFGRKLFPCNYRLVSKLRYSNLAGMQLSSVNRPQGMVYAMTAYYDRKISEKQRVRLAYTLDDYSFKNIGLMYTSTFNKFNVYLAANNLLALPNLAKANSFSMQLGMQLIF